MIAIVVRIQFYRFAKGSNRNWQLPFAEGSLSQRLERLWLSRIELRCPLCRNERLIESAFLRQRRCQHVVRYGIVLIDFERVAKNRNGFVVLTFFAENYTKIVVALFGSSLSASW